MNDDKFKIVSLEDFSIGNMIADRLAEYAKKENEEFIVFLKKIGCRPKPTRDYVQRLKWRLKAKGKEIIIKRKTRIEGSNYIIETSFMLAPINIKSIGVGSVDIRIPKALTPLPFPYDLTSEDD